MIHRNPARRLLVPTQLLTQSMQIAADCLDNPMSRGMNLGHDRIHPRSLRLLTVCRHKLGVDAARIS